MDDVGDAEVLSAGANRILHIAVADDVQDELSAKLLGAGEDFEG